MTFPQLKAKHLEEALFHPKDFVKYKKLNKKDFPANYILTYQVSALNYLKRKYKGDYKKIKIHPNFIIYLIKDKNIGFVKMFGIGSPYAVTIIEELIALGAKKIINIGTAGGLKYEGVFLCERAIRDEGTSHHYLAHGKYSYPDKKLTEELGKGIKKQGLKFEKSTTWTIDAPYRETKKEIECYRKEGVATVEMEASALFAVAKLRGIKIASAFVVSDTLIKKWNPKFHHVNVVKTQNKLIDAAVECLSK